MSLSSDPDSRFNVASRLSALARDFPDKIILVFPYRRKQPDGSRLAYRTVTYAQLEEKANRLAGALKRLGLEKGDRAVVMVPMSLEAYLVIIALLKLGAVTVFIDPWVGLSQLDRACRLVEPKAFIGTRKAHLLRLFLGAFRKIPLRVVARGPALLGEKSLDALIVTGPGTFETVAVGEEDPALVTFTTGSTAIPKGANRTHGFLMAQQRALLQSLPLPPQGVDMPALPIFVLKNLACNVTSVLPYMDFLRPAKVDPVLILEEWTAWKVSTCIASPAFFEPIARYCLEHDVHPDTIQAIYTGGAPVRPELMEKLARVLPKGTAYTVYGSTEAEPISLISAQEVLGDCFSRTREGGGYCVGRPVQGLEVRIIRIQEGPVDFPTGGWEALEAPPQGIGEVVLSGEWVNREYYKNPQAVKENKFTDGTQRLWHRTGDSGYFDEQGRLWLVGRVKHRVLHAGKEIHPLQVEPVVDQLPFVGRSALIGLPDPLLGQRLVLVVQPRKEGWLSRRTVRERWTKEVKALCSERGVEVEGVAFVNRIPLDPRHQAKIEYGKLKRAFQDQ